MRLPEDALVPEPVLPHTYYLAQNADVIVQMPVRGALEAHFNVTGDPLVSGFRVEKLRGERR